jgi:type II secretory ATPase GspE/PulE/Tfp pilus assembly ATPase PilB-like protein
VNLAAGITFARGLRSILRQDPDVIMVGEIRDRETAEIAVQSALTGHLVFSSLHTNDAASALPRLLDMGVEPFLIASSIIGVIGQRLVRMVCRNCTVSYTPERRVLEQLGVPEDERDHVQFARGAGCPACNGRGYRGRTGVFEVLRMSDPIRRMILDKASTLEIREQAAHEGMQTMQQTGLRKVMDGTTTPEEVMRVIYVEEE